MRYVLSLFAILGILVAATLADEPRWIITEYQSPEKPVVSFASNPVEAPTLDANSRPALTYGIVCANGQCMMVPQQSFRAWQAPAAPQGYGCGGALASGCAGRSYGCAGVGAGCAGRSGYGCAGGVRRGPVRRLFGRW